MAFDSTKLDPGASSKGIAKLATYQTTDAIATVAGATYFDGTLFAEVMSTGDVLLVIASDATKLFNVTVSGTDVTLSTGTAIA